MLIVLCVGVAIIPSNVCECVSVCVCRFHSLHFDRQNLFDQKTMDTAEAPTPLQVLEFMIGDNTLFYAQNKKRLLFLFHWLPSRGDQANQS